MDTKDEDVDLDNQRFQRWLERLQDSIKEMNSDEDAAALADIVQHTIDKEESSYPAWLSNSTKTSIGRLASSSDEMQVHLRHIVLPHALQGYRRLRADLHSVGPLQQDVNEQNDVSASILADSSNADHHSSDNASKAAVAGDHAGVVQSVAAPTKTTGRGRWGDGLPSQAIVLPPQTAPVSTSDGASKAILKKFFEGIRDGRTDGLVGLCNVADVHHRLTRALEHDSAQLTEWVTAEEERQAENELLAVHRERKLQLLKDSFLSDDTEGIVDSIFTSSSSSSNGSASASASASGLSSSSSSSTDMVVTGNGGDGGKPDLNSCMGKLQKEVSVRSKVLEQAKEEEDRARRIYEEAIRARRTAAASLENIEEAVDTLKQRRELLLRVLSHRLQAEKYNATSAAGRLGVFRSLHGFLNKAKEDFDKGRLAQELPKMFESLIGILESNISQPSVVADGTAVVGALPEAKMEVDGDDEKSSSHVSQQTDTGVGAKPEKSAAAVAADLALATAAAKMKSYCSLRAGLEAVRVWRQLCGAGAHAELKDKVSQFEASMRDKLIPLPTPTPKDPEAKNVFRRPDATIVLFYDDNKHATPVGHVESQARVKTCLRMISAQLNPPPVQPPLPSQPGASSQPPQARSSAAAGAADGEEPDPKRIARRERRLHMLSCSDIISPPLWCLPLVHSPQYLAQLWGLAQEAKDGDLYVPLEFDTEWESDEAPPNYDSDDDDPYPLFGAGAIVPEEKLGGAVTVVTTIREVLGRRKRRQQVMLKRSLNLSSEVTQMLGADAIESFAQLLEPELGDDDVAEALLTIDAIEAKKLAEEEEDRLQQELRSKRRDEEKDINSRNGKPFFDHRAAAADRVKTPWGDGTLINKEKGAPDDKIVQVQLAWGAIGYFNSSCVRPYYSRAIMRLLQGGRVLESSYAAGGGSSDYLSGNAGGRGAGGGGGGATHHRKRVFHQYQDEDMRKALKDAKADVEEDRVSMVVSYPNKDEVRNTFLYAVVKRVSAVMGAQSGVANMIGVTQGIMSLWINGRTSLLLSNSIQKKLMECLKEYDEEGLMESMGPNIEDLDDGDEEEEADGDAAEDANGNAKPRPAAARVGWRGGQRRKRSSGKGGKKKNFDGEKYYKLSNQTDESDSLRDLIRDVMARDKMSQGILAKTLNSAFGRSYNQSGMSAWLYYRQKMPTCWETTGDCIQWLKSPKLKNSSSQKAKIEELEAWYKLKSEESGFDFAGDDGEEEDDDEEEEEEEAGDDENKVQLKSEGEKKEGVTKKSKKDDSSDDDDIMSIDEDEEGETTKAVVAGARTDKPTTMPLSSNDGDDGKQDGSRPPTTFTNKPTNQSKRAVYPPLSKDDILPEEFLRQRALLVTINVPKESAEDTAVSSTAAAVAKSKASKIAEPQQEEEEGGVASASSSSATASAATSIDSAAKTKVIEMKLPRTVSELHTAVTAEIRRRGIAQIALLGEAGLVQEGFSQSNVSRFVTTCTFTGTEKGYLFLTRLFDWLKASLVRDRDFAAFEDEDDDENRSECPICGMLRSGFTNSKGFYMHLMWCRRGINKRSSEIVSVHVEEVDIPPSSSVTVKRERDGNDENGQDGGEGGQEQSIKRIKSESGGATDDIGDDDQVMSIDTSTAAGQGQGQNSSVIVPVEGAAGRKVSSVKLAPSIPRKRLNFTVDSLLQKAHGKQVTADTFKKNDRYLTCEVCHARLNRHRIMSIEDYNAALAAGTLPCQNKEPEKKERKPAAKGVVASVSADGKEDDTPRSESAIEGKEEELEEEDALATPAVELTEQPEQQQQEGEGEGSEKASSSSSSSNAGVVAPPLDFVYTFEKEDEHGLIRFECSTCPCIYHRDCLLDPSERSLSLPWFCYQCRESGAHIAVAVTEEQKADPVFLADKFLLVYAAGLRRWRLGKVLHRTPEGYLLITWVRRDLRRGLTQLLNISNAHVLLADKALDDAEIFSPLPKVLRRYSRNDKSGSSQDGATDGAAGEVKSEEADAYGDSDDYEEGAPASAEVETGDAATESRASRANNGEGTSQGSAAGLAAADDFDPESEGEADGDNDGVLGKRSRRVNVRLVSPIATNGGRRGGRGRGGEGRGRGRGGGRWGNRQPVDPPLGSDADAAGKTASASPGSLRGSPVARGGGGRGGRWGARRGGRTGGRGGYLLMDGDNDGSVTQRDELASRGIGGVSGLRWADDEDDKPRGRGGGRGGGRWGRGRWGRGTGRGGRGGRRSGLEDDDDTVSAVTANPEDGSPGKGPDATTTTVGMSDTYVSATSLQAALCAAGTACRAVDVVMCGDNTNAFACTRPPGHHAGRYGCTAGCLSTGFCLLNNAAIATVYARVRWGLSRVAVVDIDVHFGNGTAELLRGDPGSFFASIHMIYGNSNEGFAPENPDQTGDAKGSAYERQLEKLAKIEKQERAEVEERDRLVQAVDGEAVEEKDDGSYSPRGDCASSASASGAPTSSAKKHAGADAMGFYPAQLGATEVTDNYVSVGVFPPLAEKHGRGFRTRGPGAGRAPMAGRGGRGRGRGRWWSRKKKVPEAEDGKKEREEGQEDNQEEEEGQEGETGVDAEVEAEDEVDEGTGGGGGDGNANMLVDEGEEEDCGTVHDDDYVAENEVKQGEQKASQSATAGQGKMGTLPELRGAEGFRRGLRDIIIPQMEKFKPEMLIISAGFDGFSSDPLGGELSLTIEDYNWATEQLMEAMDRIAGGPGLGRVVSLLEGGYDTQPQTLGLARCVDAHVRTLRSGGL